MWIDQLLELMQAIERSKNNMKMSKKPSSKHLLVARILLGLFFVSFVIIFILKLVNVSKTNGKIGADFMTVLTGFGVTLAKPVKWGAGLDEFCNIAMITWIPLILIVSLIFYILYYKNLVKTIQVEDSTTKVDITIKTEGDVIVETEKEEQPMKKEEVMVVEQLPMSEPEPMMSEPVVEPEPVVMPMPVMVEPETKPTKNVKRKKFTHKLQKVCYLKNFMKILNLLKWQKYQLKQFLIKPLL